MFIFVAVQYAEGGKYPFRMDELAKLREPLQKTLYKLNMVYKQIMATPEGHARLQKLMAAVEAVQPSLTSSMPPPTTLPEDIASKLPKGLRVEDLKPPPAKRQKGTAGKASPSQSGNAATPEAKTPVGNAESPAAPSSSSKKGAAGSKRKRQPSTSRTPSQLAADIKNDMAKMQAPPVEPAKDNMLGINLDSVEAEIQNAAPFLAAYDALRPEAGESNLAGTDEIWSALIAAVDEYNADPANHSSSTQDISDALGQAVPPMAAMPKTSQDLLNNSNGLQDTKQGLSSLAAVISSSARDQRDDDLFAQFIDVTKVDDTPGWALPTPELFRVASRDDDADDTSPESIKTVGSTTAMSLKTPINTLDADSKNASDSIAILGGLGSPENNAYNGMILGGWEDETFGFITAS